MAECFERMDELGKEGLLRDETRSSDTDQMRRFITEVAWSIQDEKLLRMLYIRAKTLKRL